MVTDTTSRLRQQLRHAPLRMGLLLTVLMRRDPMIRGMVYRLRRKCGKAGCRCRAGPLHESWVLAVSEKGVKRLRPVPKGWLAQWTALTGRYRRVRKVRAELVRLFAEVLNLADALERERTVKPPEG